MFNKFTDKLRSNSGFSLAEVLFAILILLMATSVVAGGVPAAANAYQKVSDSANAQVLLSTTASALKYQLGTATDVKVKGDNAAAKISYISADTKEHSELFLKPDAAEDGQAENKPVIMLKEFLDSHTQVENISQTERALVPKTTGSKNIYLTWNNVNVSDGVVGLTLQVMRKARSDESSDTVIVEQEFAIRTCSLQEGY